MLFKENAVGFTVNSFPKLPPLTLSVYARLTFTRELLGTNVAVPVNTGEKLKFCPGLGIRPEIGKGGVHVRPDKVKVPVDN